MNAMQESQHKERIRQVIKKINQSWLQGRPEELSRYLHENMMIVSPEFQVLGAGRQVCIKSYVDFIRQAQIQDYQESEPNVYLWGETAIAFYDFAISWEMNGKSYRENGRDFFALTYANDHWLAVWRMLFPEIAKN